MRNSTIPTVLFSLFTFTMAAEATELRVRPSALAPDPGIVLGDTTDNYVGAFRVRAVGLEDLVITRFSLHNMGVDETIGSVTVGYYNVDGDPEYKTGFLVNGTVTFSGTEVLAPEFLNPNAVIAVYVDGGDDFLNQSGMRFRLDWVDDDFEAVGLVSGITYDHTIATDFRRGVRMIWHESKPTVFLSAGSPFGAGIPGNAEVLRVNYVADSHGDIGNEELEFELDASDRDPNGYGWNTCGNLADETKWDVYDLGNPAMPLIGDWVFETEDGTDCSLAPDEVLVSAWFTNIGEIVAAGYTTAYSIWLNTTGASPAYDDIVHLYLVDLAWYDGSCPRLFNSRSIEELPVGHDDPIQY